MSPTRRPHERFRNAGTNASKLTPEGSEVIKRIDAVLEALTTFGEAQVKVNDEVVERLDRANQRFEKMDQHLGYLRGAHAINAAERNAGLIADDMGYQLVSLLPREVLIGLANIAREAGKSEDNVRSFREADLVMLARDHRGQPAYIAVEASFTVASKDINRAKRNAAYLHEFTGLPAKGVVAGVDIASGREQNAIADGVHCYHIPVRYLQAD